MEGGYKPGPPCLAQHRPLQSSFLSLLSWLPLVPFQLHLEKNLISQAVDFYGCFMNYCMTF